jgi:hypothetical protein
VGFKYFGYEVIKKGGEALGCHLMRGKEAPATLRFDFILALEVDGRWRAEWRAGERRLGQRKETTPKVSWVGVGHAAEKPPGLVHDFQAGTVLCTEMGQKAGWAGLKTRRAAGKIFSNFIQGFEFKNQGIQIFSNQIWTEVKPG